MTASELAFRLGEVRHPEPTRPVEQTLGVRETRGATMNGSQVHSLRLPGYDLAIEIIMGAKAERLTMRHDSLDGPEPYIKGTLLGIRKVHEIVGLVRGLDRVMGV